MSETLWFVVDVGCYECGVATVPIGAFWTKAEAKAAAEARNTETRGWRDGGQTSCYVYEVSVPARP